LDQSFCFVVEDYSVLVIFLDPNVVVVAAAAKPVFRKEREQVVVEVEGAGEHGLGC
jgi:hypothetical protein